jgi:hypothetical protein
MLKNIKIYESFISEDYRRSDIANLFGSPEDISLKQDFLRIKALLWLYKYQTEEEKLDYTTRNLNGVGFTGPDAPILTSFAKQVVEKYHLTEKQLQILRRKIKKYENQMAKIANAIQSGEAQKDPKIEAVAEEWKNRNMGRYSY